MPTATFSANFDRFDKALSDAKVSLFDFDRQTSKAAQGLQRMVDSFSGKDLFAQASRAAEAVARIGGAANLTEREQAKLNRTLTEALDKYRVMGVEPPAAIRKLAQETEGAAERIRRSKDETTAWGGALGSVKTIAAGFLAGFTLDRVINGLASSVKETIAFSGRLTDLADQTGVSTTALQRWKFAAEQSGNTLDQLVSSVGMLQDRLGSGEVGVVRSLERLGLSFDELRRTSPRDAFEQVAAEVAKVEDANLRATLATDLFGRAGREILPTLRADLAALGDEAQRLGLVIDGDTLQSMDRLDDTLSALSQTGRGLMARFLEPMVPALTRVAEGWRAAAQDQQIFARTLDAMNLQPLAALVRLAGLFSERGPTVDAGANSFAALRARVGEYALTVPSADAATAAMAKTISDQTKALRDGEGAAKRLSDAINKLTGRDKIAAARELTSQLTALVRTGASLDPAQFAHVEKTMGAAIETARRLGVEVDPLWQHWYLQTVDLTMKIESGLTPAILGLGAGLRKIQDMDPFGKVVEDLAKIEQAIPGLPGGKVPGQAIGMPASPPDLRNFWQRTFGSSAQIGATLASTVTSALTGGGNVSRSIGATVAGTLASGVAQSLTKEGGKLAGTVVGGALSAALPVVGGLAGSLLGGLVGNLFGPSKGAIAGKQADAELDQLRAQLLQVYGSLENLEKAGGAAGKALADAWGSKNVAGLAHFKRLIGELEAAQAKAQQHIKDLGELAASGGLVSQQLMRDLVAGADNPEIQAGLAQFQQGQTSRLVGGLQTFLGAGTIGGSAQATAIGAGLTAAIGEMRAGGASTADILRTIGPLVDQFDEKVKGIAYTGTDALGSLRAQFALVKDDVAGPAITALGGVGDVLGSLHNLGLLNQETFSGLAAQFTSTYLALEEQGKGGIELIRANQGEWQRLWELSQDFGYELDENTRKVLEFAEENGAVGDKFRPAQERMVQGIEKLIERFDSFLNTMVGGLTSTAQQAAGAFQGVWANLRIPEVTVPFRFDPQNDLPGGATIPGLATGGIVRYPTVALLGERGPEAVVPLDRGAFGLGEATVNVYLDGRLVARNQVPHLARELAVYGV